MEDIERIDEHGPLDLADVQRAVYGLAGKYAASDLYNRYASAAREAGRLPAHPVALGQEFRRRGYRRCKVSIGGVGRGNCSVGPSGLARQVVAWYI